ncbi:hypothetical protein FRB93_006291 [Tulasnella sp. JGI-2019a]|nr:hypothetical protein FRB93_006291 [Tulasnella sp. JGI-2019a]
MEAHQPSGAETRSPPLLFQPNEMSQLQFPLPAYQSQPFALSGMFQPPLGPPPPIIPSQEKTPYYGDKH